MLLQYIELGSSGKHLHWVQAKAISILRYVKHHKLNPNRQEIMYFKHWYGGQIALGSLVLTSQSSQADGRQYFDKKRKTCRRIISFLQILFSFHTNVILLITCWNQKNMLNLLYSLNTNCTKTFSFLCVCLVDFALSFCSKRTLGHFIHLLVSDSVCLKFANQTILATETIRAWTMLNPCLLKGPVQACSSIVSEKSKAKPTNCRELGKWARSDWDKQ